MTPHPLAHCFLFAFLGLSVGCNRPAAPSAAPEEHAAPVKAVTAHEETLGEWTALLGATQPLPGSAAKATAQIEGHVISTLRPSWFEPLDEGSRVQAGTVLVQLDDRVARANRDKIAATAADLDEQDKQAEFAVEKADLELKSLERLRRDVPSGSPLPLVSQIELDKAVLARKDAQSRRRAVAAKQTALAAELKGLDAQLDYFKVRAPIAGRLGQFQVTPGQTLAIGATVAEVVDLDEVDVLCAVPPYTARRLALDQPARLAEHPEIEGHVVFIALQAQPETGNLAVKVRFPNKDGALRLNTVARVQVQTQPEKERLVIPEAALLEDQEPPCVVVAEEVTKKNEKGEEEKVVQARRLVAVLGVRDRDKHLVEIVHLKTPDKGEEVEVKGARFIVEGAHGLKDEDAVKLEEEKKD